MSKSLRSKEDVIDALIYLHIILEVSLNGLFRNISLADIKKTVNEIAVIKNLDSISFIDKATMFIYNSNFDFNGRISEATDLHKIIGKLKNFSGIRNQLLHGHAILTINDNGTKSHSPLQEQLNDKTLIKQVRDFQYILGGIQFYLDSLRSSITQDEKAQYAQRYLSYDFIPNSLINKTTKNSDSV